MVLSACESSENYAEKKTFLKYVSHYGAIRIPLDVANGLPPGSLLYNDPRDGMMLDPTNRIYKDVLRLVWPDSQDLEWWNDGTVGDLVEAFLGLAWKMRSLGKRYGHLAEDFIAMLELALLAHYILELV